MSWHFDNFYISGIMFFTHRYSNDKKFSFLLFFYKLYNGFFLEIGNFVTIPISSLSHWRQKERGPRYGWDFDVVAGLLNQNQPVTDAIWAFYIYLSLTGFILFFQMINQKQWVYLRSSETLNDLLEETQTQQFFELQQIVIYFLYKMKEKNRWEWLTVECILSPVVNQCIM